MKAQHIIGYLFLVITAWLLIASFSCSYVPATIALLLGVIISGVCGVGMFYAKY